MRERKIKRSCWGRVRTKREVGRREEGKEGGEEGGRGERKEGGEKGGEGEREGERERLYLNSHE